jgi:histidyl-tRNA synthetase
MKPSIPKGTRDFSSAEMTRRNYIFDTVKKHFHLYGFEQIETPAMENLTTLTGKYGEEGDQLLFKILNSRIHESKEKDKLLSEFQSSLDSARNTTTLTERALRYDLTVPFARYVVMHQHEITFPFKRFQMQTVWRADKPQKGRYREFYQCDADIIGSNSLINEIELINLMNDVYTELNIPVTIKYNNRKILQGIADYCGCPDKLIDITVAIDKLDKIGKDAVKEELKNKGISNEKIENIFSCIFPELDELSSSLENFMGFGFTEEESENILKVKSETYRRDFKKIGCLLWNFNSGESSSLTSPIGVKGCNESYTIFQHFGNSNPNINLEFDPTLARGLNYYTGAIFEVKANAGTFTPSITGGGRYDDLTGIFGLPNMSGVGISFGIDRIYDVMEELNLFPAEKLNTQHTQLLLMHMGEAEQQHGLQMLSALRHAGIRVELYPDVTKKMNKQFDYATKKDIPYLIVIGSNEMTEQKYTLKTKDHKFVEKTINEIIGIINGK